MFQATTSLIIIHEKAEDVDEDLANIRSSAVADKTVETSFDPVTCVHRRI